MSPDDHVPADESSFERHWRRRFESFASHREDDAGIAGWSATGLAARLRNFASTWPGDRPGALWLDVGCGAGTYSRYLAGRGLQVVGMDYSAPSISKARDRSGTAISWCIGDAKRLPVRSLAADGVICFGVLQALDESEGAIREAVRAVRTGGAVWFDALNRWCLPAVWERLVRHISGKPMHLRYESAADVRRLMHAAGLSAVRVDWLPILPSRWQRLQGLLESRAGRALFRRVPLLGALLSHAFVARGCKT